MGVKERIREFTEYKGISPSMFERMCFLSNGFINSVGDSIRKDSLDKISKVFPELNRTWLIMGDGEMINASEKKSASKFNFIGRDFANDSSTINSGSQVFGSEICNECKKKDNIIFDLQQEISNLKSQIIDLLIKK